MDWIFLALSGAALIHILEEYKFPGGFLDFVRRINPQFAPYATVKFAISINGLFVLLCAAAAIAGGRNLTFSLSVASLLLFNALLHVFGTARVKGYAPGLISALLLYIPLSLCAYYMSAGMGRLTTRAVIVSGILGALYQAVPIGYFGLLRAAKRV